MFVLFSSLRALDHFLLLGTLDFLSIFLGIDSLNTSCSLPGTRGSGKVKSLKTSQSELQRGKIHQGNLEVLDVSNWPKTQQLD